MNRMTDEDFDGSAGLAPTASPPFTRLESCAIPKTAAQLTADLYQGRCFVRLLLPAICYRWLPHRRQYFESWDAKASPRTWAFRRCLLLAG